MTDSSNIVWRPARALLAVALSLWAAVAAAQTGPLTSLVVANLSPAFSPGVRTYSIPRTSACSVPVTATLADTTHKLYIASSLTASGATRNAWVCDGRTKIDIVVYKVWTEVGRYTINVVDGAPAPAPAPTPPPAPAPAPTPSPTEPAPTPAPAPEAPTDPFPPALPVDMATAARFLEQATFGPTPADVAYVQANGIDRWLHGQFLAPETTIPDGLDNNQLRALVFRNMATAPDQLRQRMAFALGQTLVVSANKNVNGYELIPWVRLISKHTFGNYKTLLREVTLSPTMGKFLDLANSTKAMNGSAPNENYPRELLQLFSIGIWQLEPWGAMKLVNGQPVPAYDQHTLKEVSRALTGWTYPTRPGATPASQNPEHFVGLMEPRPLLHDVAAKTFFGKTLPAGQAVTKDLDDTIDVIFNHPNVPPFVATRLIRSLVTSNPSTAYIQRVANVFINNGQNVRGDLRAVLKAVLTDPEAAVAGTGDGRLKDPVLHVIGLGRALGAQFNDPNMFLYYFANLGELVLSPPTVFSFYSPLAALPGNPSLFGPEFQIYSPALAVRRANFIYDILNGQLGSAFRVDLAPFVAVAGNIHTLVEKVNQTLLFGRMSSSLRQAILNATQATSDVNQRAFGALYLAAISSEYAVHNGNPVQ